MTEKTTHTHLMFTGAQTYRDCSIYRAPWKLILSPSLRGILTQLLAFGLAVGL